MATRSAGYRFGSWLVLHGSGAHLVGFSTACWLTRDGRDTMGLWATCHDSHCTRIKAQDVPEWLAATRVLGCVGVALVVLWLVIGCHCQCIESRQKRYKWLSRLEELLAIFSGLSALLSVGVFATASGGDPVLSDFSLSWSVWLVVGGALACTVGGFIVGGTRDPTSRTPKPNTRSVRPTGTLNAIVANQQADELQSRDPQIHGRTSRMIQGVPDVFSVIPFANNAERTGTNSGHNPSSPCWTEIGEPPPPYSFIPYEPSASILGQNGSVHEAPTPVHELSVTPPPSYQTVMNELPPPYEPTTVFPTVQLVRSQ